MVEGIPDRHEPQPVTGRWSRRSRRLPHDGASDGAKAPKRRVAKATPDSAEEGEATGVSEARSKNLQAPWEDNAHARSNRSPRGDRKRRGWTGKTSRQPDGVRSDPPKRMWMQRWSGANAWMLLKLSWIIPGDWGKVGQASWLNPSSLGPQGSMHRGRIHQFL
jgi:hypothetical protein